MSRDLIIQMIVNFLTTGFTYALLAIGLTLIFGVMKLINFAHGQMYMLGAFLLFYLYGQWSINYVVAVLMASIGVAMLGLALERAIVRPVQGNPLQAMVVTLGLLLALEGAALVTFGPQPRYLAAPVKGVLSIGGAIVPVQKIVAAGAAALFIAGLGAFLKWMKAGAALRAVAQDREAAFLQGVRAGRMNAWGFVVGSGLAAAAGALILPLIGSVDTGAGDILLPKMFTIVVIGGLGSVSGALVGAFLLALIETIGFTYLGQFATLSAYLMVIAVLLLRPEGLLGRQGRVG